MNVLENEHNNEGGTKVGADIDQKTGQPIEEAEHNLSRHSTGDSSKPVEEVDKDIEPPEK